MRLSRTFFHTLREDPADAEIPSHRLMLRAGLVRRLASGVYLQTPLGQKLVNQVAGVIREEMNRAGAAEVGLSIIQPAELWQESGRWPVYGPELMRLKDRHGREFALGPTHEEVITTLVRDETKSYKQLPFNLYQIQTKFRDEMRPRFGVMRAREFLMKDAYSFHATQDCLDTEYQNMRDTYHRIFERCGLQFAAVEADSGAIGGSGSEEFLVLAGTGENAMVSCPHCGYNANLEQAPCAAAEDADNGPPEPGPTEDVSTPDCKTIDAVVAFLKEPASNMMKNILFIDDQNLFHLVSVRADHEVNDAKLTRLAGATGLRPAPEEEIVKRLKLPVGYITPQGLPEEARKQMRLYLDHTLLDGRGYITGSNVKDVHRKGVIPGAHFTPDVVGDFRFMVADDPCPKCGKDPAFKRGIEVGHIFKLGTKYSEAMNATFQDDNGRVQAIIMGCYGIGVTRTVASVIEQCHDEKGIVWPRGVRPCDVAVIPLFPKGDVFDFSVALYQELQNAGLDALLDDRNERPGVKFGDADLVGWPWRVVLGKGYEKNGELELVCRATGEKKLLDATGKSAAEAAALVRDTIA